MFSIQLPNGEFLDLGNSNIRMHLKSPIFQAEGEPATRSYTLKIPFQENALKLNEYCLWGSRKQFDKIEVKAYLQTDFWAYGQLEITDHTDDDISIKIGIDKSYYASLANKKLSDFEYYNPYRLRFYTSQLASSSYFFDDTALSGSCIITFTFFVTNNTAAGNEVIINFTYNKSTENLQQLITRICDYFNERIEQYRYYFEPVLPLANDFVIYNLTTVTNSAFFFTITKDSSDFTVSTITSVNKTSLQSARALFSESLDANLPDFRLFTIANPNLFSFENPSYLGYVNLESPRIPGEALFPGQLFSNEQPVCPQPRLQYIINAVHNEFGVNLKLDDFFTDAELKELYLANYTNIFNSNRRLENSWPYLPTGAFMFKDILPNITFRDLTYALKIMFGLIFDYSSRDRTVRMIKMKTILKSKDVVDITDRTDKSFSRNTKVESNGFEYAWSGDELSGERLPLIFGKELAEPVNFKSNLPVSPPLGYPLIFAQKENIYYRWNPDISAWVEHAEGLYNYNVDADNTMQIKLLPVFTSDVPFHISGTLPAGLPFDLRWRIPYAKEVSNQYPTDNIQNQLRLLFYRGERSCLANAPGAPSLVTSYYHMASAHNYDFNRNKVGNYSLALNHEDGLIAKFLKEWIDFLDNTTLFKFRVRWTAIDIINIDLIKKLKFRNQEFLIDNIEFDVKDRSITNVIITCYLVKPNYEQ